MISSDASLAEVSRHAVDAAMSELYKAGPGIVTAYDPVTNTAFIKPAVKRAVFSVSTDERAYREPSEIPFVPVIFPRAGGMVARLPVSVGDTVLLVFCDESLAEWRTNGGVTEPQDARKHSIGWPVAIPGFYPDSEPPSPVDGAAVGLGAAIFGEDGGKQVRVSPLGIELAPAGVTPVSPVALAVPLLTFVSAISAAATAGGAADATVASALSAILAYCDAAVTAAGIVATPAVASAKTAATGAVAAAGTSLGASGTAATAAGTAATVAAGAVPSTITRAV